MRHVFLTLAAFLGALAPVVAQPPAGGLDLVPTTAFGFISVRTSDLRDVESLKPVREAIARIEKSEGSLEQLFGVRLDEVDRITAFWPTAPMGHAGSQPIVIVTTRGPYNEARVLKALQAMPVSPFGPPGAGFDKGGGGFGKSVGYPKAADHPPASTEVVPKIKPPIPPPKLPEPGEEGAQVKGEEPPPPKPLPERPAEKELAPVDAPELYFLERGALPALFLLDDRTLVFLPARGDEGAGLLHLVGQLLRRRADGPLADALALASKHTLVAGVRVAQVGEHLLGGEELPREMIPFRSLFRARTAALTADFGAKATVTARLTFADAAGARRAEPVLKTLIQTVVDLLADQRKRAAGDAEWAKVMQPLLDLAAGSLEKAEVTAEGTVVSARVEAEIGPAVAKSMAALPDLTEMATTRQKTINNLKQIGIAIHNYHDQMGHLPANVVDATGRPILSWRVQLLPYLEHDNTFRQLDMTKPWDDPRNAKLLEKMPDVFRVYGRSGHEKGLTYFHMPTSPQRVPGGDPFLVPGQRRTLATVVDGLSNTIMVVEAADGVPWARPGDVVFNPAQLPKLGAEDRKWFHALFGDGAVRTLRRDKVTDQQLRALLTVNGGEVVTVDEK
jgi:hypothetical protein